jgi:hypothetical protein
VTQFAKADGKVLIDSDGRVIVTGLDSINSIIEQKVQEKLRSGRLDCQTYNNALRVVAMEFPQLFLSRALMEIDGAYRHETIYFDVSPSGLLINPKILKDFKLVPIPSPLDMEPISSVLTPEQELAVRVADKMQKVSMSEREYGKALLMVSRENPNLMRRRAKETRL